MVGVSVAICSPVVAVQAASAAEPCVRSSLVNALPHRRCAPFRSSGTTFEARVCCGHSPTSPTTRHQSHTKSPSWQLRAVRNSKHDRHAKQDEDDKAKAGDSNIMTQSAGYVSGLVNELLYGAASRMERGQTTCIKCKGSGTKVCNNCKGQGVMQAKQLHMHSTATLRSNRCQKCHGNGQTVCNACEGRGFRGEFE